MMSKTWNFENLSELEIEISLVYVLVDVTCLPYVKQLAKFESFDFYPSAGGIQWCKNLGFATFKNSLFWMTNMTCKF